MRSIKTTVTAAAVLTAGFMLTAPAAHAATAPQGKSACATAVAAAQTAEKAYNAAIADLKKQVAAGGHPGIAEEQNAADLKSKANSAASAAARACQGSHTRRHPHGSMRTGAGSTSQGVNGGEVAGGMGILGAAGLGALAMRRRRAGSAS